VNRIKSSLLISLVTILIIACENVDKSIIDNDPTLTEKQLVKYSRKTFSQREKLNSPEEELAGFKVPEGFVVELVASERDGVINPIDITFDDAGKLWTQTAQMYPLDPVADVKWNELIKLMDNPEAQEKNEKFKHIFSLYRGQKKGKDKILVISNLYNNSDIKTNVWADGLSIPQSILPYKNGSYVAQGSELFFLSDTDNDGKADKRTPLLTGFGITDTHTMAHLLVRAPGDWIHFSHGALNKGNVTSLVSDAKLRIDFSKIARFSLDAKKLELVNAGLNNIWGFQLRGSGQWYASEANDLGYSVVPMEGGTAFPGIGSERVRSYQPWYLKLHDFRLGGTGVSGIAFSDDDEGSFPKAWKDVAFIANPITSKINAVKVIRNPDGTVFSKHLPDFLTSEDDWFRPVNMEFGPDGSLYFADWYNKIISHNELPTTHPDRDKSHGRIFRIRHKSQKPRTIENFYEVKTNDLVEHLKSPSLWAKRAAWHQISDRPIEETKNLSNELLALASDKSQSETTRILALWSIEDIHYYDKNLIRTLLASPEHNLRREAVRSLASFSLNASAIASALEHVSEDSNPMVRSQVLRTLNEVGVANAETINLLVKACKPELEGNEMGGSYERNFERFLARKTLESYSDELKKFIASPQAEQLDPANLIWASQALEEKERERIFLDLWGQQGGKMSLNESTFIIAAKMLSNPAIFKAVKPTLEQEEKAETYVKYALKNLTQVQSSQLTQLLSNPVKSLLQSKDESTQRLGLEAIGKLRVKNLQNNIIPLIKETSSEETLNLILLALENQPEQNKMIFLQLAKNNNLKDEIRVYALHALVKVDQPQAITILTTWLPKLDETQQKLVANILSGSKNGASLLKKLFKKELLLHKIFDISSAEKIHQSNKEDPVGIEILDQVKKRQEEDKKAFETKLEYFMAIAEKEDGNAKEGEGLFQTCILCHSVGDKGYDYAPALDGSALRENEALLTAILNPDAALEGYYAVYRVTKNDESNIEGYLIKRDDRGTSIGFMGGAKVFIQASEIKSQSFIGGRSFMPKWLIDDYSDKQVADLLAYIKTLK
jgi:putative membrane-bound dehydrogenase-like protein|tara:strand:+ start:2809 stop:6000 length:3192 start_codon:yes stop_codon:yes gene_type:complete